MFKLLLCN